MTDPRQTLDRRLSVAPMMDRTDRHCRYFLRLLAPRTLLYTEMIPAGAILHGDRERFLGFDPAEHPVALQVGGSDPEELARCAALGEAWGYDEINLNLGCPSERVSRGGFGARLMLEPALVADCVAAMREATAQPVTVKIRIGVDDCDDYGHFAGFVDRIAAAGVGVFIVHARKALLSGLSPKENREIPPLHYEFVHRLKGEQPELTVVINGGFTTKDDALQQIGPTDGVMLGRAAYDNPFLLAEIEAALHDAALPHRAEAIDAYAGYVDARLADGVPLWRMTRHVLGLYQGIPGARAWRRTLAEGARRPGATGALLRQALRLVERPDRIAA
ncbi:MAG: tRNA dihydrouridine(20/20a) synthase DusA [Defluviicoccus sp.]|nr:tRNA dihydrouridine(20/20a) synthase DusA [Defluviicoccus sp.]